MLFMESNCFKFGLSFSRVVSCVMKARYQKKIPELLELLLSIWSRKAAC